MSNNINWQQFGLKGNPYDTVPLGEGGSMPIEKAFVGRTNEREFIDGILDSEDRLCLAVCGETGVGKTSLLNFEKLIWKYKTPKLLFSFRREIEACEDLLSKRDFIIEVLASIIREIKLIDPKLLVDDFLKKVQNIVDISQDLSISAGLSGGYLGINAGLSGSKGVSSNPPIRISTAMLESYFKDMIEFIRGNKINGLEYSGLIVHVNNFDVLLSDPSNEGKLRKYFNEIRDLLQTPHVYYFFLGPSNLFKSIISHEQRVKSIFIQNPLMVKPLTKTEVVQAFNERMDILQSDEVSNYIKPVQDEVVSKLYDLYEGDIRSIMTAVRDIIGSMTETPLNPLDENAAMILLGKERLSRIEKTGGLSKEQRTVLKFLAEKNTYITQKEASTLLKKPAPNISGYYFKPLREYGIIEEKERKGRTILWGLTTDYIPIRWAYRAKDSINKHIKAKKEEQPSLFEQL